MGRSRGLLASVLASFVLSSNADIKPLPWVGPSTLSPLAVELFINGKPVQHTIQVLADADDNVYLRAVDLLAVGLPISLRDSIEVNGYLYLPLNGLTGYQISADRKQGRVSVQRDSAPMPSDAETVSSNPYQPPRRSIPLGNREIREVPVRVILNQQKTERQVTLLQQHDRWLIASADVRALGLPLPDLVPLIVAGQRYLVIDTLWPYRLDVDPLWQLISIDTRPATSESDVEETWVELNVNESRRPALVKAYRDDQQRFYLDDKTLQTFKLRTPQTPVAGDNLYAVDGLDEVLPMFDPQQQSLALYARAGAFEPNRVTGDDSVLVEPDFDQRGAMLNYALFGSHSGGSDRLSGQFELGAFAGRGFFSSQHLVRDITSAERNAVRLETNLRIDWPEQMRSMIIGDALSEAGAWGRPARFGGLKWGTDFSTQPGFITFPTELIAGETVVPSTVDIFVNNARRSSAPVEPGPFAITEVPVVTGAGEMRVVTRDLFGRESVVSRPFYASSRLLKSGLHEYSYELGVLRQAFTRQSNDYAGGFASGTHRYGFTRWFTGELRGEASADHQTVGLATNLVWPAIAEFDFALAGSLNRDGQGGDLAAVGFRRQAQRFSFGASAIWRSERFTQLGSNPTKPPDARETTAYAALGLGEAGNLSVSHVQRVSRDNSDIEFATLQYSISLARQANLRFSFLEPLSDDLERTASAALSMPLGRRTSGMVSARRRADVTTGRIEARKNLPAGNGFGYHVSAETGDIERLEAGTSWRNSAGLLTAQAAQLGSFREYRASFDGGIALMNGGPYFSQRLDQSFALVEVPTMEGVSIYRDNQHLATTNREGKALVPGLRDYQKNRIRLGDAMLPLNIEVASLEQTTIPPFRQGVTLTFAIKPARWVGFRLLDANNLPVPAGAQLLNTVSGEQSIVGANGQGYIEIDPGAHEMQSWWHGHHCRFTLIVPDGAEPMPDLGSVVCQ